MTKDNNNTLNQSNRLSEINHSTDTINSSNISGQNFSPDANESGVKSSEEISKQFEAKASNLGYGVGKFFSNNPVVKAVSGFFGAVGNMVDSLTSSSPKEINENSGEEISKTNRVLLQTSNPAELSAECQGIIRQLDLDDANKEFLLKATNNLIDKLTLKKIEKINNYLLDVPDNNLNDAATIISESFAAISQTEAQNFLKDIHDNSNHPGSLRTYLEICIKRNPNLTHSPTPAPTTQPTKEPTNKPSQSPVTSSPSHSPTTHVPTYSPTTHSPTPPTNQPTNGPDGGMIAGTTIGALVGVCVIGLAAIALRRRHQNHSVGVELGAIPQAEAAVQYQAEQPVVIHVEPQRRGPALEEKKEEKKFEHWSPESPSIPREKTPEELEREIEEATKLRFNADMTRVLEASKINAPATFNYLLPDKADGPDINDPEVKSRKSLSDNEADHGVISDNLEAKHQNTTTEDDSEIVGPEEPSRVPSDPQLGNAQIPATEKSSIRK